MILFHAIGFNGGVLGVCSSRIMQKLVMHVLKKLKNLFEVSVNGVCAEISSSKDPTTLLK